MQKDYDLLIIGGGMVGASLARAVVGCGLRIGLVEAFPVDAAAQPSYDDRVIALAYGSRLILEAMGVWDRLAPEAEPIRKIHISDRGHFGFTRLDHREERVEALGYVIGAQALGRGLWQGLEQEADIELICPARLQCFDQEKEAVTVELLVDEKPEKVRARLLVAADGGHSRVRRQLGIDLRESPYEQTAIIANITPEQDHRGVAYERFTDSGPLAMLPMVDGLCSLVWTAWDHQVEEIMALDDAAFLARLQERFGWRLGRLHKTTGRVAYPLKLVVAKALTRGRIALAGNAAHTVHPVSGQGYNLGIRDVAALAEVIADAAHAHEDPGSEEVMQRYEAWRCRDLDATTQITDTLARLFANPFSPVRHGRSAGLLGLDLLPGVKHLVSRQFMGLNGTLPKLARGVPLA